MTRIKIGDWTVVPTLNLLERNGESIRLEPRAMDLLVYLAAARERVVSADELLREVWQSRVFDDGIVYKKINQLRKALGDDPQGPRFIETIPKRGYRLVAAVVAESDDPHPSNSQRALVAAEAPTLQAIAEPVTEVQVSRRRRWFSPATTVAAGAAVAVLGTLIAYPYFARSGQRPAVTRTSVAVLPCENLSEDPEKAFALGVHEALINQLMKVDFDVPARTVVMPYLASPKPFPEIARELNVGAIVECSVQYAEGQVRIGVALADAATSKVLWADSYDEEFANIFAIQSDIARNVADALHAQLSPGQLATLEDVPSRNGRANELYFSARRYEDLGVVHWPVATELYENAVKEDPRFALAYAQLALLRTLMFAMGQPPATADQVREAAEKALELKHDLVESQIAMIGYRFFARIQSAEQALEELNAIEPQAQRLFEFYGIRREILWRAGQFEESLADATRAVEIGPPQAVPLLLYQARNYLFLGRYEEASRAFDHVANIAPDDWGTLTHRAGLPLRRYGDTAALRALQADVLSGRRPWPGETFFAAWMDGDTDHALQLIEKLPGEFGRRAHAGIVLQSAGQTERARPLLEAARDELVTSLEADPTPLDDSRFVLGLLLSYLGETEEAVRTTRAAVADLEALPAGVARRISRSRSSRSTCRSPVSGPSKGFSAGRTLTRFARIRGSKHWSRNTRGIRRGACQSKRSRAQLSGLYLAVTLKSQVRYRIWLVPPPKSSPSEASELLCRRSCRTIGLSTSAYSPAPSASFACTR